MGYRVTNVNLRLYLKDNSAKCLDKLRFSHNKTTSIKMLKLYLDNDFSTISIFYGFCFEIAT